MNIFRQFGEDTLTKLVFRQLIESILKVENQLVIIHRKGPGDGTNDSTGFIDELAEIRRKLGVFRDACDVKVASEIDLNSLSDLADALGWDVKIEFKKKEPAPQGTEMKPHMQPSEGCIFAGETSATGAFDPPVTPLPTGYEMAGLGRVPQKVFNVGDIALLGVGPDYANSTLAPVEVVIACLEPLIFFDSNDERYCDPFMSFNGMKVIGQAPIETLTRLRGKLTQTEYASSGKITRKEI